ncbi:thiol-disulfide oxidoreductase DCC family protein [Bacillus pinisoli]|uniref:thiol-disulfide oxidoreductase DCC family protein n=1 Tax=Bacillus pinisoli TaxID=2901866 RepID=UPI001FF5489E|nr:thiol-disulfide oxidoreductase DCC family protein [Bacillus pinisoli]
MEKSIVFFDGECNLCNGAVQFLVKHDVEKKLMFASLQSKTGQQLLHNHHLHPEMFETMIFQKSNKVYFRSNAALAICQTLGGRFSIFNVFYIIPKRLRDFFYNIIAKNRYKWFGKREQCMVPTPELRKRFLD